MGIRAMETPKAPGATLDYTVDWEAWLEGDTVDQSVWVVPAGLTKVSDVTNPTTTTVFIYGGFVGQTYLVTNRITTTAGRVQERSFKLDVRQT